VTERRGQRTVTLMFTDLVASTELLTALGDEVFDDLRRRLFAAFRRAAERHSGLEVKNLGDGLMLSFDSVVDAVDCAIDTQREMRRAGRPAGLRIGLAVGEAMVDDGDYFGKPVVEASRLCARAGGGQILATDVVRVLAARRGDRFVPVGPIRLKGITEPVEAVEIRWEDASAARPPLPSALIVNRDAPFAGRTCELDRLREAWAEVGASSSRRTVLVAGEPGVGKTRLAGVFGSLVSSDGLVLFGRCDESFGTPYEPVAEALSPYVSVAPASDLAGQLGPLGGDLTRLLPRLAERVPALDDPIRADPETARYRLFEAVNEFVTRVSVDVPVLLIIDDIHWAAASTLALLHRVVRGNEPARLLTLLTFRESEVEENEALAGFVRDARRCAGVERVELAGLRVDDVASLLEQAAGHQLDRAEADLTALLHAETEGNPFFIGEILRHLREAGALRQTGSRWRLTRPLSELDIPDGAREVIGERLRRLPDEALAILATGAVIGREFDLSVLRAACGRPDDLVLDALEGAERARLLGPVAGRPGRFSFSHALVRSVLYAQLPSTRRMRLHRAVGRVLEARPDAGERIDELAHHFFRAAPLGESEAAVRYATGAGDRASADLAFEQAAVHYDEALEALALQPAPAWEDRWELLLRLGEARSRAGDESGRDVIGVATDEARAHADWDRFARAVLALNPLAYATGNWVVDPAMVALVEEALAGLGPVRSALRARLLANLAIELMFDPDYGRRLHDIVEAVATARSLDDRETLGRVLVISYLVTEGPDGVWQAQSIADELVQLGNALNNVELLFRGFQFRYQAAIGAADLAVAEDSLAELEALAERLRQPVFVWTARYHRAAHLMLRGRPDEGERAALRAYEAARVGGPLEAMAYRFYEQPHLFLVRWDQGRLHERATAFEGWAEVMVTRPVVRAVTAFVLCAVGRHEDARPHLEAAIDVLPTVRRDFDWVLTVCMAIMAAVQLDEAPRLEHVYDRLLPLAGRVWWNRNFCLGPVDLYLGMLATACGRFDVAEGHFIVAAGLAERLQAPGWLARVEIQRARMILQRSTDGDRDEARAEANRALRRADEHRLEGISAEARAVLEDLSRSDEVDATSRSREPDS
jgi:class 3 adenylate cyclase/tetratricopeptide (TPR) repeat protein